MPILAIQPCLQCRLMIPIAITSAPREPGEPIVLTLDEADWWAHAWTHEYDIDQD